MTERKQEAEKKGEVWVVAAKHLARAPYIDVASRDPFSETWLADQRSECPNPYFDQTTGGLFVEFSYGYPGWIHTPVGGWQCWGSGGHSGPLPGVEAWFPYCVLRLYSSVRYSVQGEHGPVYEVLSVRGATLPSAVARERGDYIPYDAAKALWRDLNAEEA